MHDGTLLARLARNLEEQVGDELRTTEGVFAVVSNVPFESEDVDHVVLAPRGVFAVEVKQLHGKAKPIAGLSRGPEFLDQAQRGAKRVRALLASKGCFVDVHPLLVLAGAGSPDDLSPLGVLVDGVPVMSFYLSDSWRLRLTDVDLLQADIAERAVDILLDFRLVRWEYEASRGSNSDRVGGAGSRSRHLVLGGAGRRERRGFKKRAAA